MRNGSCGSLDTRGNGQCSPWARAHFLQKYQVGANRTRLAASSDDVGACMAPLHDLTTLRWW